MLWLLGNLKLAIFKYPDLGIISLKQGPLQKEAEASMSKKKTSRNRRKSELSDEDARAVLAGFFSQLVTGFVVGVCADPQTEQGVKIVQDVIRHAGIEGAENYRKRHTKKR